MWLCNLTSLERNSTHQKLSYMYWILCWILAWTKQEIKYGFYPEEACAVFWGFGCIHEKKMKSKGLESHQISNNARSNGQILVNVNKKTFRQRQTEHWIHPAALPSVDCVHHKKVSSAFQSCYLHKGLGPNEEQQHNTGNVLTPKPPGKVTSHVIQEQRCCAYPVPCQVANRAFSDSNILAH